MAYELIGEHRCVIEDFYDVDGQGRNLSKHHSPQRVRGLEVEVLDDEVGALVVGLYMAELVLRREVVRRQQSGQCTWRKRTLIAPPSGS
jgi:hypothetical protein